VQSLPLKFDLKVNCPVVKSREGISNTSAKEAIEIYKADGDYPKFYRNFVGNSDNGRASLRLANTFCLKITSIKCFGAAVVVWVDGDGLLPSTTICLVR
jgi:hypothetical protein